MPDPDRTVEIGFSSVFGQCCRRVYIHDDHPRIEGVYTIRARHRAEDIEQIPRFRRRAVLTAVRLEIGRREQARGWKWFELLMVKAYLEPKKKPRAKSPRTEPH